MSLRFVNIVGSMLRTHFEEKVILLKFVHYKPCVFIICGKNLTDEWIGIFF